MLFSGDCVWRRDWDRDLAMTTVHLPKAKAAVLTAVEYAPPLAADPRLMLPAGVTPFQPNWPHIVAIGGYHAAALMAFMPGYFSWSGLVVALLGTHLCGLFGINLCYPPASHHRGLKCPKWLEHAMAIVAMSCLQETPARWVAIHRRHHQFADEQPDPHSPLASFFWSHVGWILVHQPELSRLGIYQRYAKDILRDRFYVALERNNCVAWINLGQMPLFFAAGFAVAWLSGEAPADAAQTGLSILLFGVFVRTVLVWHITWAVNSVTHLWGYRITRPTRKAATTSLSASFPTAKAGTTTTMPIHARRATVIAGGKSTTPI